MRDSARSSFARGTCDQLGDVVLRRGPEPAEVPADEVLDPGLLGRVERTNPLLGQREKARTALCPGARRRHANQVEPVPEPP